VDTLPICSALSGQESVWTTLHTMIHVWAQMAGAQIRLPEPPQVPEPPHVPLQPGEFQLYQLKTVSTLPADNTWC
jgi:hypothetical protein